GCKFLRPRISAAGCSGELDLIAGDLASVGRFEFVAVKALRNGERNRVALYFTVGDWRVTLSSGNSTGNFRAILLQVEGLLARLTTTSRHLGNPFASNICRKNSRRGCKHKQDRKNRYSSFH